MEQTYVKYFYNELPLKNWTMNMHFNPITILYDFLVGGGIPRPPVTSLYIDLVPPTFIGLTELKNPNKSHLTWSILPEEYFGTTVKYILIHPCPYLQILSTCNNCKIYSDPSLSLSTNPIDM